LNKVLDYANADIFC